MLHATLSRLSLQADDGRPTIWSAAYLGDVNTLKWHMNERKTSIELPNRTRGDETPLICAVKGGSRLAVDFILAQNGVNVDKEDDHGDTGEKLSALKSESPLPVAFSSALRLLRSHVRHCYRETFARCRR